MFSQSSKKYQTDAMLVKISSDTKIACKNFPTISRESKNSKICSFPHIDLVLVSTAVQRLHAASLGALIFSSNRLHKNNMQPVGGAHQQSWLTHWRSHHSWVNFSRSWPGRSLNWLSKEGLGDHIAMHWRKECLGQVAREKVKVLHHPQ